jgi:small-conductance mechanosensitive channel
VYDFARRSVYNKMKLQTIFSLITLKSFSVTRKRKRQFLLALFALISLILTYQIYGEAMLALGMSQRILLLAITTLSINVVTNALRFFVVSSHRKRHGFGNEEHDNFTVGMNAVVNTVTVLGFLVAVFVVFDIEVRSFLNSIALFAVALTLIFQDYIKNILNGFSIMFSADFEIGDLIQVHDLPRGVVINITFFAVHLKTEAGDLLSIPNNLFKAHEIVNYSRLRPRRLSLEFPVLREQIDSLDNFRTAIVTTLQKTNQAQLDVDKTTIRINHATADELILVVEVPCKRLSMRLKREVLHVLHELAFSYRNAK